MIVTQQEATEKERRGAVTAAGSKAGPQPAKPTAVAGVSALQRTAGNRAVEGLLKSGTGDHSAGAGGAPPVVSEVLGSGSGQPLDPDTRKFMESRFDQDFSQVRLHSDAMAAESTRALDAAAWTVGDHIVLGQDRHHPDTVRGRRLLAHELTHVLQQANGSASGAAPKTAETEATQAAEQAVRGAPISVQSAVPVATQRQTVAEEKAQVQAEAQKEGVPEARRETKSETGVGIGFQAWNVFKHHVELKPPGVDFGPVYWTGFSFEAEVNPQIGKFNEKSKASSNVEKSQESGQRSETPTQVRVGKVIEKGEHGTAFGVQAEIEPALEQKIEALGMKFEPKVKGGGKLTSEGAELGVEGKLEGEDRFGGLKFTFAEIDWEKGEFEFNKATWIVGLVKQISLKDLQEFVSFDAGELDAVLEVKITYGFEFKPNYLWRGWRTLIAEASQAIRTGAAAISRVFLVAETGELTAIGAGGLAATAAVAYVVWIAYGMYQLEMAHEKGKRADALEQFVDGYAHMLAALTELNGHHDERILTEVVNLDLLSMPWKETMKEYMEAYVRGNLKVLLPGSKVYQAGEAAIAQDVFYYLGANGNDKWLSVAASLRKRLGETSGKDRFHAIRNILKSQIASGASITGIPLE